MTERQILAVLTLIAAGAGMGFAIYSVYYAYKYPNSVSVKR